MKILKRIPELLLAAGCISFLYLQVNKTVLAAVVAFALAVTVASVCLTLYLVLTLAYFIKDKDQRIWRIQNGNRRYVTDIGCLVVGSTAAALTFFSMNLLQQLSRQPQFPAQALYIAVVINALFFCIGRITRGPV